MIAELLFIIRLAGKCGHLSCSYLVLTCFLHELLFSAEKINHRRPHLCTSETSSVGWQAPLLLSVTRSQISHHQVLPVDFFFFLYFRSHLNSLISGILLSLCWRVSESFLLPHCVVRKEQGHFLFIPPR